MCGIAGGVWTSFGQPIEQDVLDRMTDVLRHRGPDGRGVYRKDHSDGSGVALGHRRLSIIDLAGGGQPLSNEDDTVWITFNGEIYNYRELRPDLEQKGHRFRTDSDTEVIVHLYEQYGVDCLERLNGMFAFAIWDERRRRLFLARDRAGEKPLLYYAPPGRLLFASEIKSLLQAPGTPREMDPMALDAYLTFGYVPHPRTMFTGIAKLPPAHYAMFENGRLEIRRYWSVDYGRESHACPEDLREQLRAALSESVRLRMRSDVPLGAFLSGGIDSTSIVGLMREHSDRVKTCTIGFPVDGYDESGYARIAAEHLGTEHHELQVQPDSLGMLPQLVWHFDEPFADSSAIPTYFVSQATRRHVTVALTGDGGDELFAGYPRYRTVESLGAFDRLPDWLRGLTANRLWNHLPGTKERSFGRRLRYRMETLHEPPDRRYSHWVSIFPPRSKVGLYTPELLDSIGGSDAAAFVADAMGRASGRSPGTRARLADLVTYLPCDLLPKVDITSMACALECRAPFLDHRVIELAASLPFNLLCNGFGEKPFLTGTLPDLIPPPLR
ncbi:MAG: asparagine synthase (glutamine-hydrolyzing), partial [Planctomycetes bacterium]|nr:asparagine synthase (glutamine-hydrolyzing) [Planctomycetota bacterium]